VFRSFLKFIISSKTTTFYFLKSLYKQVTIISIMFIAKKDKYPIRIQMLFV